MKQDIRDLFEQNTLPKKKLPELHREAFLEKLNQAAVKKPTKNRFYIKLKVAVSIAAVITVIILFQTGKENFNTPIREVVDSPIDSSFINTKKVAEINKEEVLIQEQNTSRQIAETPKKVMPNKPKIKMASNKKEANNSLKVVNNPITKKAPELVITKESVDNKSTLVALNNVDSLSLASSNNDGIKVNSKALLYSITHSKVEVLAYYKENNLTRASVLKDIEYELNKSSLAINAEDLLSEIELGLNKKSFKEKLLTTIKVKLKELSNTIVTN